MRKTKVIFESLEQRQLLSAVYPSAAEQYMVELYNWARANPNAAVTKYGTALNEGPPYAALTADAKQPLAINLNLTSAAHSYAQYMIDHDGFGHTVDGNQPATRMTNAGYVFTGSYSSAENAGLTSVGGGSIAASELDFHFLNYYVDGTQPDRGHRVNIFNPGYKEIGSGAVLGNYNGFNAVITVHDFALSGTNTFLTGVAYTDSSHNNFYTPGEEMSGVTVMAIRNSDSAVFSTTTWSSGGYTLALPPGTYTVWGSGGTLGNWVKYSNVAIGSENVKRDFRPDYVNDTNGPGVEPPPEEIPFAVRNGGKLTVTGTDGGDTITLSVASGILSVTLNSETLTFAQSSIGYVVVLAGEGNDSILASGLPIRVSVYGGAGNDSIVGGIGADTLKGDAGNDTIYGGAGNDRIYGGDDADTLYGEIGHDRLWGNGGNDSLNGGSHNDSLYGDDGNDSLWGSNGNDFLDGRAGADYLSGGRNIDTVDYSQRTANLFVELAGVAGAPTGNSGEAGENDNVVYDIENINGGAGHDRLIGNSAANIIHGNGGNDTIYANGGGDRLYGEAGKDRFFTNNSILDRIDGGADRDTVAGDLLDLLTSVEVS